MKKTKFALIGLIVLILGIGFYLTPHLAVHNMKKAARNNDADALSRYVDYPSVRESLKANLLGKAAREVSETRAENPFEALQAAFAAALINPMLDALVTPEGLAMLMKGKKPQLDKSARQSTNEVKFDKSKTETSKSYKDFNHFVVRVKEKDSTKGAVEFTFKRDGLISWKLTFLRLL
ncbi:MAG TPA: DUF2939 domain-containing protein [Syntrophobacteria bacterium]|nr:DUF2939 domain-containing protein [Syntrophobacteria bacterium]